MRQTFAPKFQHENCKTENIVVVAAVVPVGSLPAAPYLRNFALLVRGRFVCYLHLLMA
jgi:hypothetical protein